MKPIGEQLKDAIDCEGLTLLGVTQIVGAETDEHLETIEDRFISYCSDQPPEGIKQFEADCLALGYVLELVKLKR